MADRMEYTVVDQDGGTVATAAGRMEAKAEMNSLLEASSVTRLTATGRFTGCDGTARVVHRVEAHRLPGGVVDWAWPDGRAW